MPLIGPRTVTFQAWLKISRKRPNPDPDPRDTIDCQFFAESVILNRISVNDDKDDDEDKAKKKICSIAPLNVVDIHEMIMDKTNNEEELRKIELKLEPKELSIDLIKWGALSRWSSSQ